MTIRRPPRSTLFPYAALFRYDTLIFVGDGDPALGDPRGMAEGEDVETVLRKWTEAVQRGGVTRVGTLIVDDRVFDRQWAHPDWPRDQLNRWYCAEVAGINFHQNCLGVYPQPTMKGQSPIVTLAQSQSGPPYRDAVTMPSAY